MFRSQVESNLGEKCAVFGVHGFDLEVARLTYYGLYALQHRGQESSGIVTSDSKRLYSHHGSGLVANVYRESELSLLHGNLAVGHNRYSTSGSQDQHLQPIVDKAAGLAFAHNGNLPSVRLLEEFLDSHGVEHHDSNDSEMMAAAIGHYLFNGADLPTAVEKAYPLFTGAFSCVAIHNDTLVAFRDACGIRPLALGRLEEGWAVSSETCAFDTIGAAFQREIKPGEMVIIDSKGVRSRILEEGIQKMDIFEFVYFARPDSQLLGKKVNEVRRRFGAQLAREHKIDADIVIPVPDSGIPSALGFSEESGIRFDHGLIKNRYIHRTFIRPSVKLRGHDLSMKLNPLPEILMGKRVVVVDDSIVRGATTKKIVRMLYGAGAKEVCVLISSPPVKFPDFYGIDTPRQKDLIAATKSIPEIKDYIGCDYLGYLSYDGMMQATGIPANMFSASCFDGIYPIDIRERASEIKKTTLADYQPALFQ